MLESRGGKECTVLTGNLAAGLCGDGVGTDAVFVLYLWEEDPCEE